MRMFKQASLILLSLCLTFCATCSLLSAQATETNVESETGNTLISVSVTAASQPEFSVSIPSGIDLGDLQRTANSVFKTQEFTVGVEDIQYLNGKTVTVTLSASGGEFCLYNGAQKLPFKVYLGDADDQTADVLKNSGDTFATFTEDGSVVGYVQVDQERIRADGSYSGSLIFTVRSN